MPERRKEDEKMFLVTDLTHKYPRTTQLNDTKDVGDVIVGITGNTAAGRTAELIAANMQFGNECTCADTFRMRCVQNNDVTVAIAEDIAAVAHAKMARCMDDYAERIWAFIGSAVTADVLACTDGGRDGFSDGDVALAIGWAIADRLGIEV